MQGYNIHLGSDVYVNFGAIFLDCNTIHIGASVEPPSMAHTQANMQCVHLLISVAQAIVACWHPMCNSIQRGIHWTQ